MIHPQMFSTGGLTPGQQAWTTAGTYSFVVPDYCYQIAAVCIGSGASGATAFSSSATTCGAGGGGATTYHNTIDVTPGETLTIVVGAPGSLVNVDASDGRDGDAVKILRGATVLLNANGGAKGLLDGQVGGNGGAASAPAGGVSWAGGKGANGTTSAVAYGGTSGKYMSAGSQGGTGNAGGGLNLCASLFGADTGTNIGRGGDGVRSHPSGAGYVGGARIIWGFGRSFPSNAADV